MLYSKSSLPSILKVLHGQIDAALGYSCRLIVVVVVVAVFVLVALAVVDVVAIVVDADAAVVVHAVVVVLANVAFLFICLQDFINDGINKIHENFLHE